MHIKTVFTVKGTCTSQQTFLRTTKDKWNTSFLQQTQQLWSNLFNAFFSSIGVIFLFLERNIAVISDMQLLNGYFVLWIDDGPDSSKEPPQTAWPKFLSTFVYASLACIWKRDSHYNNITLITIFDDGGHPQVIRVHMNLDPIINYALPAVIKQQCIITSI